jgi:hypothetical protein
VGPHARTSNTLHYCARRTSNCTASVQFCAARWNRARLFSSVGTGLVGVRCTVQGGHIRCQAYGVKRSYSVSGVRCQAVIFGVRCTVSVFDFRCTVSGGHVRCQIIAFMCHVFGVWCQMFSVYCSMSGHQQGSDWMLEGKPDASWSNSTTLADKISRALPIVCVMY